MGDCPLCGRALRGRLPVPVAIDVDDGVEVLRHLDPDATVMLVPVDDNWEFVACVHARMEEFDWTWE